RAQQRLRAHGAGAAEHRTDLPALAPHAVTDQAGVTKQRFAVRAVTRTLGQRPELAEFLGLSPGLGRREQRRKVCRPFAFGRAAQWAPARGRSGEIWNETGGVDFAFKAAVKVGANLVAGAGAVPHAIFCQPARRALGRGGPADAAVFEFLGR